MIFKKKNQKRSEHKGQHNNKEPDIEIVPSFFRVGDKNFLLKRLRFIVKFSNIHSNYLLKCK